MENNFDRHIREKLTNLQGENNPEAWSLFEEKLDLAENMQEIDDSQFDNAIADKLEGINVPYDASTWALLEDKIDLVDSPIAQDVNNLYFDAVVYDNLNGFDQSYNPEHWDLMEERLDEEFSLMRKLYRYKVGEAAIMLLALLTFYQYFPLYNNAKVAQTQESTINDTSIQQIDATTSDALIADASFAQTANKTTSNDTRTTTVDATKNTSSEKQVVENNITSTFGNSIARPASSTTQNAATPVTTNIGANNGSNNNTPISTVVASAAPSPSNNSALATSTSSAATMAKEENTTKDVNATDYGLSMNANELPILVSGYPKDLISNVEQKGDVFPCKSCKQFKEANYLRVGMFSLMDVNYIMTPYEIIEGTEGVSKFSSFARTELGYGGGISMGFRLKKWEIESGAIYSDKLYKARQLQEITGNTEDGYLLHEAQDIQLSALSIPLHLRYNFDKSNKWDIYTLAGGSMNTLLQLSYYNTTEYVSDANPSLVSSRAASVVEEKASPASAWGVFNNGNFIDNTYFTANLGMGIERYLSSRWSLFLEPTYKHQILSKGFGPDKDRFNTLSILAGAKVSIK